MVVNFFPRKMSNQVKKLVDKHGGNIGVCSMEKSV